MDSKIVATIKRQVPFLIGGTITGIMMTHYFGFPITVLFNSVVWYQISLTVHKLVWRKNGLADQKNPFKIFSELNKTTKKMHHDIRVYINIDFPF